MTKGLERFVQAQEPVWQQALQEIRQGEKEGHWMWFIFPQLTALGQSSVALYFGLDDLQEARAYWSHPVLGPRLREFARALLALEASDPLRVMGWPDNLKLRSCMTLFELAAPQEPLFAMVLDKFYDGVRDWLTLQLLGRE